MGHNQEHTPLFTGLKKYAAQNPVPFHIPGHKKRNGNGRRFPRIHWGQRALYRLN